MKHSLKKFALVITAILAFGGCTKNNVDPDIYGTWIEINNTTDKLPSGCELNIDQATGDVTLCGFDFIHPPNVAAAFVRKDARLIIKDGQMSYRHKNASFLWLVSIHREDLYFADYTFEGSFLWLVGDKSKTKATAKNVGKLFMRKP
ncbi:MAG: hypothetical protein K0S32_648 [Bacteroidetes bacterium]|jgi:hypothetical protein|nr:hypothetical protein [Bacteroidota bacterium]